MLTATYSLAAISAEQKNARSMLGRLQTYIHGLLNGMQERNMACVQRALEKLEQFEDYCRRRKVETHVIPAIRKRTHKADRLLGELESLRMRSAALLQALHRQLRLAVEQGAVEVGRVCVTLDACCTHQLKRLAKEEEELFPIVRGLLPTEAWFDIAAKMLSENEGSRSRPPARGKLPPLMPQQGWHSGVHPAP